MARYIATPEVPTGFANRCVYSTPGTYTFTVPSGVTSIKAIAVGGGSDGSNGFIKGATVTTDKMCIRNSCVIAQMSGCCCYTGCISSILCGYSCIKHCLPELKTCYYAFAGSGGGYAEKTISVSPGDQFCVTVGNKEETSSFGTEISASGAQQPCICCGTLFACGVQCTNLPCACTVAPICCCNGTGYRCIHAQFRACCQLYCTESSIGNHITCIAHKPGTGTGGDKNYTGGCGADTSIISDELSYGIQCFHPSYHTTACGCSYLTPQSCYQTCIVWVFNNNAACSVVWNSSFWNCVGNFCAYECFTDLSGNTVFNSLCTCLLKDYFADFRHCEVYRHNTWYGTCEPAFENRCKPQVDNIPCKYSSSGDLRAEVELSYSGPSSGSPLGDGKPGACSQFIGTGPTNESSPIIHFCACPEQYTQHFFRCCGCNHYCTTDSSCCWSRHPWYKQPEEALPHFYNNMVDLTTDANEGGAVGRMKASFPGCLWFNDNVFCYLEYVTPCQSWYWQNGIESGVPPAGCSCVGDKGSLMGPNQMWQCQSNVMGGDSCDGWTRSTGYYINWCGNLANTCSCFPAACGVYRLFLPYHLKGTELGSTSKTCGCTYDCCVRCCMATCKEMAVCYCNAPVATTCSCYCISCVAAGLHNTCLIKPCTTIETWACYTIGNPVARCLYIEALCAVPNIRNQMQATLTAFSYMDGKRWHYYCNGSMYCAGCNPIFCIDIRCTDQSISCCHCCASSYGCGQWWCNVQGTQVCKGNATDIVLPGSAGGPNACGNIPCQVSSSYYTTGPGADPSGVDIPKFIATGGGGSVMSQDTFNKIMHEYKGSFAAWYLRECWQYKCNLYVDGGTTCCCNCCIRPISDMDTCVCACCCVICTHFSFGCANMCWDVEKCAVMCYTFKLYACMMAELERKQGLTYECTCYGGNGTNMPYPVVTATANVGTTSGLYINSVSNNFVGQKTCLSGGGSSVTQYSVPICTMGCVCACLAGNCSPIWAPGQCWQCFNPEADCFGTMVACMDNSTEPECKAHYVPCVGTSGCYFCFTAPCAQTNGRTSRACTSNEQFNDASNNACGREVRPIVRAVISGGGSGSNPYVPEIYEGPKLSDEYLFSSTECVIGASPQICIQGSATTIAPGYSQGGGKSGCMGYLCDQQIVCNNAYNGGIFPRGKPGFGGGGTLCGEGGTGLVVVYWN